jgi:hypothetical protein
MKTGNTFLEKCLHAFELLGRLQQEGLDFVFKGGTSLLLRIPDPHRLSIDIDIVSRDPRLEKVLGKCLGPPFTGIEEDKRRHNRLPRRRHWNFHYDSINPDGSPDPYVILDVLEEDVLYPDVESIPIAASFLTVDHEISVTVPTVDNLLADKLTAFAPITTGQPYSDSHPEKMIKHLFDIGELFNIADSIHAVRDVYNTIAQAEIGYRDGAYRAEDCLDDTIEVSRLVTGLAINQRFHPDNCHLLDAGIGALRGHLIGTEWNLRHAAIAAGKAALLAALIRQGATENPLGQLRYDSSKLAGLAGVQLSRFSELNKLPGASPEAFYYWHLTDQLME